MTEEEALRRVSMAERHLLDVVRRLRWPVGFSDIPRVLAEMTDFDVALGALKAADIEFIKARDYEIVGTIEMPENAA